MRCVCPRAPPTQWEMLRYNSVMPVAAPRRRRRNRLEWEAYLRWKQVLTGLALTPAEVFGDLNA